MSGLVRKVARGATPDEWLAFVKHGFLPDPISLSPAELEAACGGPILTSTFLHYLISDGEIMTMDTDTVERAVYQFSRPSRPQAPAATLEVLAATRPRISLTGWFRRS